MTCAKRRVVCNIFTLKGIVTGENSCEFPQKTCPRAKGEDYTKCKTICNQGGHAEIEAIKKAKTRGLDMKGATAEIFGHYYCCKDCAAALCAEGINRIIINIGRI